jgi:gluconolactonase
MRSGNRLGGLDGLVAPDAELRCLGTGYGYAEGPVWSAAEGALYFSDIPGDARWRWTEAGGVEEVMSPSFKGNGLAFDVDGNLIACEHVTSSVARFTSDGRREVVAFHYEGRYLNSPNDVVVRAADGGIYFTDPIFGRENNEYGIKREGELGFSGLYRVAHDGGECELLVDEGEFEQPNGLCFSPDGSLLYVNDEARSHVKVWDVQPDGSLADGRLFFSGIGTGTPESAPDGQKCDEEGNLWVTGIGGVWVISPTGERLGILEVPEEVGNLAWGGPDRRSLFLASSTTLRVVETRVAGAPLPGNH